MHLLPQPGKVILMEHNKLRIAAVLCNLLLALTQGAQDLAVLGAPSPLVNLIKEVTLRVLNAHNALVAPTLTSNLLDSEVTLLREGKKIHAIREVRSRLGLGLAEAKNLVEAHPAHADYLASQGIRY